MLSLRVLSVMMQLWVLGRPAAAFGGRSIAGRTGVRPLGFLANSQSSRADSIGGVTRIPQLAGTTTGTSRRTIATFGKKRNKKFPPTTFGNQKKNKFPPSSYSKTRLQSQYNDDDFDDDFDSIIEHNFKVGDKVLLEVVEFGYLGATVHVVASSHDPKDLPPEDQEWPVKAIGLVPQQELAYFRDQRRGMEVVLGEVLPGYVERVREDDRKLAVGLRAFGGRQKAMDVGQQILQLLKEDPDGVLGLGDKSAPDDIAVAFPGVSKGSFKKAVSALYKQGIIDKPQPQEISLNAKWKKEKK